MKIKVSLVLLLLVLPFLNFAQILKKEQTDYMKKNGITVVMPENEELSEIFKKFLEKHWNFAPINDYIAASTKKAAVKNDKNIVLLEITTLSSRSMTHRNGATAYRNVSKGAGLLIKSKGQKLHYPQAFPTFGDDNEVSEECLKFAVQALQNSIVFFDESGEKSNLKLRGYENKDTPILKDLVLYVPEGWLHKKLSAEQFSAQYNYKSKIVSYEVWREAILTEEEGIAYIIVVPFPIGGKYIYIPMVMEASTGKSLATAAPKSAVSVAGFNVSKGNTGYINERTVELLNENVK